MPAYLKAVHSYTAVHEPACTGMAEQVTAQVGRNCWLGTLVEEVVLLQKEADGTAARPAVGVEFEESCSE